MSLTLPLSGEVVIRPQFSGPEIFIFPETSLTLPSEKNRPMRSWFVWLCGLLLWLVPTGVGAATYNTAEIINATNSVRTEYHRPALRVDSRLQSAALAKAQDMIARQYFSHQDPAGQAPWRWLTAAGYSFTEAGENLAFDFIDGQDVVPAWLRSATHRANILNQKFIDVGVAVVDGTLNGSPTIIVVQLFGRQTAVNAPEVESLTSQSPPPPPSAPVKAAGKTQPLAATTPNKKTLPIMTPAALTVPSLVHGRVPQPNLTFTYKLPDFLTSSSLLSKRYSRVAGLQTSWTAPVTIQAPDSSRPNPLPAMVFTALIGEGSVLGVYGLMRKQKAGVIHSPIHPIPAAG